MSQHLLSAIKSAGRHPGRAVESVRRLPARGRVLDGSAQRRRRRSRVGLLALLSMHYCWPKSDIPQAACCSVRPSTSQPAPIHMCLVGQSRPTQLNVGPDGSCGPGSSESAHMGLSTDCPTRCRLYQNHQGHRIRRCKCLHTVQVVHTHDVCDEDACLSVCPSVFFERHRYIHTYRHTCIYVHTHTHIHTYTYTHTYTHIHTHVYTPSTHIHVHIHHRGRCSCDAPCDAQPTGVLLLTTTKKCPGRAAIWRQGSSHGGPSEQQQAHAAADARQGRTAARAGCGSCRNARQGHWP